MKINVSRAQPEFSHVSCSDLHEYPREKTDTELRALADVSNYVGIVAVPYFMGETKDIDVVLEHIDHAIDIVGIGTDWGYWTPDAEPLRDGLQRMFRNLSSLSEEEVPICDGILQ